MKPYRVIVAIIAWAALILQYGLMVTGQPSGAIPKLTVNFFSYFTILGNLSSALVLTLPLVTANSAVGRWWDQPAVRTGVSLYMAVIGVSYHLLLRNIWDPQGWQKVADYTLHYVMPAAMVIDWLAFTPKGLLRWKNALWWLPFPALYGLWSQVYGAISGFYPYPFLDLPKIGATGLAVSVVLFLAVFLGLGLLVVLIDGWMGRGKTTAKA